MEKSIFITVSFLIAFAAGCSTVKTVNNPPAEASGEKIHYRVISYIHGDSDYLFHDGKGQPVQADENALKKVQNSAEKAVNGEYFIFHQQKKKKVLWLFPRRNSQLYHYKNGKLVNRISYRSEPSSESFFHTEAKLIRDITTQQSLELNRTVFLYFGHEIPLYSGKTYHATRPGVDVNTASFADGIREFMSDGDRFDLIALSTCNNGSPAMIHHLQDVAEFVLASPQNLHLSHLDTESFSLLDSDQDVSTLKLAESIAESTFERLTENVQTAVTLSVYDMESLNSEIDDLYKQTEDFVDREKPNLNRDNIDCSKLPFFESKYNQGSVHTFFRPAAFGRDAGDSEHSGWGCKGLGLNK